MPSRAALTNHLPTCFRLFVCPPSGVPPNGLCRLSGPFRCPLLSEDSGPVELGLRFFLFFTFLWASDVQGFCRFCGWLLRGIWVWQLLESPVGVSKSLAFLARFLAAPKRFCLKLWRPRVPTFTVSRSRFSDLRLLRDSCSSQVTGISLVPCIHGFCSVVPSEASKRQISPWLEPSLEALRSLLCTLIFLL